MRASDLPVPLGSVLHGKYRLEGVVGVGAMGIVVSAYHVQLERRVALKFLTAEAAASPESALRFAREARAATRIQSEHVVRVLDVGETENATPFMVMEFLEGEDLSEVLRRSGPLPIGLAVEYLLQACEALAEAHAAGIVHRDLKPANLFLTHRADGSSLVKVCDFGIAKASVNESAKLTFMNAFVGSPVYSAPEQIRSASGVDARADIWALGVILYELLSADTPFTAGSFPELAARILSETAPDVRKLRPDVPEALARTIAACLERDVEKRLPNVAVLARELAESAPPTARLSVDRIARVLDLASSSNRPSSTLPSPSPSAAPKPSGAGTTRPLPALETSAPQALSVGTALKKRSRVGWLALSGGLLAVAVGGAVLLLRGQEASQVPSGAAPAGSAPELVSASPRVLEARGSSSAPVPAPNAEAPPAPGAEVRTAPEASGDTASRPGVALPASKKGNRHPPARTPSGVATAPSAPPAREAPANAHPVPPKPKPERNALDMDLK